MTTKRIYWMLALMVVTLFTTGGDCTTLTVKHGGIFKIVDNVLFGRGPLENVDVGRDGDLFGGGLSCVTGCALGGCADCAACDCSDCAACGDCSDCANCSDCAACEDCGCVITPIDFAAEHPAKRIPQAVQVRLTAHGLEFISGSLGELAGGILPKLDLQGLLNLCGSPGATSPCTQLPPEITALSIGADAQEDFALELRDVQLSGIPADGSLEASLKVFGQSVIPDSGGLVQGGIPVHAEVYTQRKEADAGPLGHTRITVAGTLDCYIDLDAGRAGGSYDDGMEFTAKLGLEEASGTVNAGYSRLVVQDVSFTSASLEMNDVRISCPTNDKINVKVQICPFNACPAPVCNEDVSINTVLNSGQTICGLATVGLDEDGTYHAGGTSKHMGAITELVQEIIQHVRNSVEKVIDSTLSGMLVDVDGDKVSGEGPWRMCQAAEVAADCPAGSTFVAKANGNAAYCQIDGAAPRECVSNVLGMQGRVDLGGALASVSPGLSAVVDFVVAAMGDSRAPNGGFNIDLGGGLENLEHNPCVPVTDAPVLPVVPVATVINGNKHPDSGADVHVGVGVSEDFVNYAAWKIFDSGMLCLNVGTALDQQLSGSMLGLLFTGRQSLTRLTFPENSKYSAFGITMRPQQAPVVSFGDYDAATDTRLVNVVIPAMELDFYAWAQDRYVRFFTLKTDVGIGVDLPIENNAIVINAGRDLDISLSNSEILNSDLLIEDHATVLNLLSNVIGIVAGRLGGVIPPIDIGSMLAGAELAPGTPLPVGINLGADALAPFSEGDKRFLGVFVNLTEPAAPMPLSARPQAQVRVTKVNIPEDTSGMFAQNFATGPAPTVEIALSANAPAGAEVEYSYHLANSGWSEWSSSNYAVIEDPSLYMQQWHTVYARARLKGQPESVEWSSARAEFLIDASEPDVQITKAGDSIELMAFDFLTAAADIEYRFRNPGEEFSEWAKMGAETITLDGANADVEVQVRDAVGNIGSNVSALRGVADPSAVAGGCACTVAGPTGEGSASPLALLLSGLALGAALLRRRKRS